MSAPRSSRLELRVTPAQKELIARGASTRGKTMSEYAVEVLVGTAQRDTACPAVVHDSLGWMRGTATLAGEIVGPTAPDGWVPRDLPE